MEIEPIKDRKIRIAVVGCGRIAERHFSAIKENSDYLELVGVCDSDSERLKKTESELKVKGYSSLTEMLANSNADVCSICTPSGVHPEQSIEIVKAGVHVVCEKPMSTRWAQALEMVKEADQAQKHLFIVKQNRFNPTLQLLKNAVDKGRFGRIYMVNVNVFWTRPQDYYDQDKWRGTWEFDGGALMNQASHYVDLLQWVAGPIEEVHSFLGTLARRIEVEDTGVVNLKWRSGALGSVNVTMLTYPKNLEGSITILGEKGTVKVGGVAVNEIEHWEFSEKDPDDEKIKEASYATTSVYGHGHVKYYENVVQTLRGEAQPYTDGREGLYSLELLIAMYLSARDGKAISLPLEL